MFMTYANQWYRYQHLPSHDVDGIMRAITGDTYREENKEVYETYKKLYLIKQSDLVISEVEEDIRNSQFSLERGVINVAKVGSGKTTFIAKCIYRALIRKEYLTVITDNKDNVLDIKDRLSELFGETISGAVLYMDGRTTVELVKNSKSVIVTHHQFLTHRGYSDRHYPKTTTILNDEDRMKGLILIDELQNFTNIRNKDITFEYPIYRSPKASSETIYKRFPFGNIPDTYQDKDGETYEQNVLKSNYVKYVTTEGYNAISYDETGDLNKYNAERHDLNLMKFLEEIPDTRIKEVKKANSSGYGYIEYIYRVKVIAEPIEKELRPLFKLIEKCEDSFIYEKLPTYDGEIVSIDEIEHYRGLRHFKGLWVKRLRIRDESIIKTKLPKMVGFTASYEKDDSIFEGYKTNNCTYSHSHTDKATIMGIRTNRINFDVILKSQLNTLVVFDLKTQAQERYALLMKEDGFKDKVSFLDSDGNAIVKAKGDETEAKDYPIKITYRDNARLRGKDLPNIECLVYDMSYSRNLLLRKTGDDILHKIRQAIGRPLRGHQLLKSFVFFNLPLEDTSKRMEEARDYLKTLVDKVVVSEIWLPKPMFEELKNTPEDDFNKVVRKGNEDWGNSKTGKTIADCYNSKYAFELRSYVCDTEQEAEETNQIHTVKEWREKLGLTQSPSMCKFSRMFSEDVLQDLEKDGISVNKVKEGKNLYIWFQDTNTKSDDAL